MLPVTGRRALCLFVNLDIDVDRRRAPDVCGHGSVPLSHSESVVTKIRLQQQQKGEGEDCPVVLGASY